MNRKLITQNDRQYMNFDRIECRIVFLSPNFRPERCGANVNNRNEGSVRLKADDGRMYRISFGKANGTSWHFTYTLADKEINGNITARRLLEKVGFKFTGDIGTNRGKNYVPPHLRFTAKVDWSQLLKDEVPGDLFARLESERLTIEGLLKEEFGGAYFNWKCYSLGAIEINHDVIVPPGEDWAADPNIVTHLSREMAKRLGGTYVNTQSGVVPQEDLTALQIGFVLPGLRCLHGTFHDRSKFIGYVKSREGTRLNKTCHNGWLQRLEWRLSGDQINRYAERRSFETLIQFQKILNALCDWFHDFLYRTLGIGYSYGDPDKERRRAEIIRDIHPRHADYVIEQLQQHGKIDLKDSRIMRHRIASAVKKGIFRKMDLPGRHTSYEFDELYLNK